MCCFIPPDVLGNVARTVPEARQSCKFSHERREARAHPPAEVVRRPGGPTAHPASVKVWDSQGSWDTRVSLAKESDGQAAAALMWAKEAMSLLLELGRNGVDGEGGDLHVNVHFGKRFMNAFWDGHQLVLGDGDGRIFTSFTASPDVVGHEIGHGLVQHTADLVYKGQPGALNEHFADVLGAAVQQRVGTKGRADWLVGNEVMGPELTGEALRSMAHPGSAYSNPLMGRDGQPGHMDDLYTGSEDNEGVHINSGIPNRMFYLVAAEVGTWVAVKLWYAALNALWPDAGFADAAAVLVERAKAMEGGPSGLPQLTRAAAKEVGLRV